jgi:hypothetical protein
MFLTKLKIVTVILMIASALTVAAARFAAPAAQAADDPGVTAQRKGSAAAKDKPRVQVRFTGPPGMKVRWLAAEGLTMEYLEVPGRYSFPSGMVFRLTLSDIPDQPGLERYPTLEIPAIPTKAESFVSHATVPIHFTDADFDRVNDGGAVTKVVYLARSEAGAEATGQEPVTLVSYDDPRLDVVREAQRRGVILAIVRMGNIDPEKDDGKETPRPGRAPNAADPDHADLQGTWPIASVEHDGLRFGVGRPENKGGRMVIAGKTLTLEVVHELLPTFSLGYQFQR